MEDLIQKIAVWALPVLLAITGHEASHAFAAKHFGDKTAWMLGRCSFNPIKHIELLGTIVMPLLCLALGGFVFGWAKPVPVNFSALRRPKQDMLWVSLAGPGANLVMALLWALLLRLSGSLGMDYFAVPLMLMARAGIIINISLMALNLLPLLPLDGGRILLSLLPRNLAWQYSRIEPYGMFILIALMAFGVLGTLMAPFLSLGYSLIRLIL
ncbi:Zn-dependent protease (includes SpoIVFB) [Formivibrio citricus]|uniref:Zn-dependent protease (Includes SpoIVFB) n=1 Tax=Formivibrio citricus TaxID=83765 RepID=A0A1I5BM35_9NEIS|nr:site-2 protease family protein [Formivibrio citricus]SFN75531.1 Zn-dependent protease (includes SpoIVFB) [Formivibrio citricus]